MSDSSSDSRDSAETSSTSVDSSSKGTVEDTVRSAVESGDQIRESIHRLIVELTRGPSGRTDALRSGVREILESATEVVRRMPPEESDSALRSVIDGVASGVRSVAQATAYAVQEASARGKRFAGEDLSRMAEDFSSIGQIVVELVARTSERIGTETGAGVRELGTHAQRAMESVAPTLKETVASLTQHPVQTAAEAAGIAVRSGRLLAGSLLSAVSGVLSGAAEVLDPDRTNRK